MVTPFETRRGALLYLLFASGRAVALALGAGALLFASILPRQRPYFGAVFMAMLALIILASAAALLFATRHPDGAGVSLTERISSPFRLNYIKPAAQALDLPVRVVWRRSIKVFVLLFVLVMLPPFIYDVL